MEVLTMATPTRLTEADLDSLVRSALCGRGSVDELVTRALFGPEVPPVWGEWPEEAQDLWSAACQRYRAALGTDMPRPGKVWTPNPLTWPVSWQLILSVAPDPRRWWLLPGVTWADMAAWLDPAFTVRNLTYRLHALGWRFIASAHTQLLRPRRPPPLTDRQREVLDFLHAYHAEHGTCPSFTQVGEAFGISSEGTVAEHMANLRAKGYVTAINRRVAAAPCLRCGQVWRPPKFRDRLGPCCASEAA